MKKIFFLILFTNSLNGFGQFPPSQDAHWVIDWEDYFTAINPDIWLVNNFTGAYHDDEPFGIHLAENVKIVSGVLEITTKTDNYYYDGNPLNGAYSSAGHLAPSGNYNYQTGSIESRGAYNFKYGYIESKIRMEHYEGMFPAFWTILGEGEVGSNPAEIDIFEILGYHSVNELSTNVHPTYATNLFFAEHNIENFNFTDWHIYGLEWTPEKIIWYVDNSIIRTMNNPGIINFCRVLFNGGVDPYAQPSPSAVFSKKMYVDYVKIYKRNNDCATNSTVCNFTPQTYENKIKKNLTLGNGTCFNALPIGQNTIFRANESIILNNNFEVPLGASALFELKGCY